MRIAWITDPHFNFIPHPEAFGAYVAEGQPDAVMITGDIAEMTSLERTLKAFHRGLGKLPVYFVLGNHDAYSGSVAQAKALARELLDNNAHLIYLGSAACMPVELSSDTWLIGVDGWYDARAGDPFGSPVKLSDFTLVREMCSPHSEARVASARLLALADADLAKAKLSSVLRKKPKKVVFATHVPPFAEATFHEGNLSDANWVPWFSNLCLGAVLTATAEKHPEVEFEVYCGHTHSSGTYQKAPNLVVHVGAARYAVPSVAGTLEFQEAL